MVQIYTWAYQDWKTITKETLATIVGLPAGITADDYKAITGEAYVAPTPAPAAQAPAPTYVAPTTQATTTSTTN